MLKYLLIKKRIMANITLIDPTQSIALAPNIINGNLTAINQEVIALMNMLSISNNSLELHGKVSAPSQGIEAAVVIATAEAGLLFNGLTDGNTQVFTVDTNGLVTALKIELDHNEVSVLGLVEAKGNVLLEKDLIVEGTSQMAGAIKMTPNIITVIPSNVGSSAANPLNLGDKHEVMIDFSNGGSQFVPSGSDALLKIDVSTLKANQKIMLRLIRRNNVNALKLWNGNASSPLFAKIDYATGIQDIVHTTYPEFDDSLAGNAWLELQYIEVSAGEFRLVILDSKNVINI